MNIFSFAVKRPVTICIVVIAILMFGCVSLQNLGIDLLPEFEYPTVALVTIYPNADPETVEGTVTVQMERALRSVANVTDVKSISMENASVCLVEFAWGTNLSKAQEDITTSLETVALTLPSDAQAPIMAKFDPTQIPLMMLTIGADGDIGEVTQKAEDIVKPVFDRIEGVAGVSINGGAEKIVEVLYDQAALTDSGLTPTLLQQYIAYQNISVPVGAVLDDGMRYNAKVGSKFTSIDDIADLVIGLQSNNDDSSMGLFSFLMPQYLTIGDVADVEETFSENDGFIRINGKPAITMIVYKQSGESPVTIANRVDKAIAELNTQYPDIELEYIFDQSDFISNSIADMSKSALIGAVLAVLILLVFLKNPTSTLVIAASIPLSILTTLLMMYGFGLNLNLMTLGGLTLGIGMLVDNSIVVLESIFRRRELGDSPIEAAIQGTKEVGMAIIASTITTVVVFVPILFTSGFVKEIFADLALTVSMSLLSSLVMAITVVPLLSSRVLKISKKEKKDRKSIEKVYEPALKWSLRKPWAVIGIAGCLLVAAVVVYPNIGFSLLPQMDMGRVDVKFNLPNGTPMDVTDVVSAELEERLMQINGVKSVSATIGTTGSNYTALISGSSVNGGSLIIMLDDSSKRSLNDVVKDVRTAFADVAEANPDFPTVKYSVDSSGMGSITAGATSLNLFGSDIIVTVSGNDMNTLNSISEELVAQMEKEDGFIDISADSQNIQPMISLDVNRTRALLGGLTVGQIGLGVRTSVLGQTATYLERDGESIPVIVRPKVDSDLTLDSLLELPISSSLAGIVPGAGDISLSSVTGGSSLIATGGDVLVGKVVQPEIIDSPLTIYRGNNSRYVSITASYTGMSQSEAGKKALSLAENIDIPEGYEVALGGTEDLLSTTLNDLKVILLIAVFLVYMVMAIQYESFLQPFIVMFTLPLALIGALLLLWVTGMDLGITSIIGLIMLAGIVVNNGIVMVDYTNQLKASGMNTYDAVMEACKTRLRPILMTSLTTILGLFPMALAFGKGAELQQPLAISVMGGLVTGTFLTLFVIPVIYIFFDKLVSKFSRKEADVK